MYPIWKFHYCIPAKLILVQCSLMIVIHLKGKNTKRRLMHFSWTWRRRMFFDLSLEGTIMPFAVTRIEIIRHPFVQLDKNIIRKLTMGLKVVNLTRIAGDILLYYASKSYWNTGNDVPFTFDLLLQLYCKWMRVNYSRRCAYILCRNNYCVFSWKGAVNNIVCKFCITNIFGSFFEYFIWSAHWKKSRNL